MAGKEYAIVVLSSSPPVPNAFNSPHYAAPTKRVAMPPSSPFALSPPSSPNRYASGALASGSRAAPIPEKAARGFATVSSLVRSEHFAQQIDEDVAKSQQAQRRQGSHESTVEGAVPAKRPAGRAAKKAAAADSEHSKSRSRAKKPKVDKEDDNVKTTLDPGLRLPRTKRSPFFDNPEAQATVDDLTEPVEAVPKLTKSGKPRKPRAKKEKLDSDVTEAKPKRTRVTKATSAAETGKATTKAAEDGPTRITVEKDQANLAEDIFTSAVEEQHQNVSLWDVPQSPRSNQNAHKQPCADDTADCIRLEAAVLRRRGWTPPRETINQSTSLVLAGKENGPAVGDAMTGNFTHLVSNFTYASPTGGTMDCATTRNTATTGKKKRRRVELVELPGVQTTRAPSPEKGKVPKKKPRTITDLVTGQYAPKDVNAESQAVTSDFFSPRTNTTRVPLNDVLEPRVEMALKKPPRKRSKSKDCTETAKSKNKPRQKKDSTKPSIKSKPVAEKLLSPTSAVSRMNHQEVLFGTSSQLVLDDSPTTVRQMQLAIKESEQDATNHSLRPPPRWPKLQHVESKRGLWRESTRDNEGGLLENTEEVYIPAPDRTQDLPLLMDLASEEPDLPTGFADIDDFAPLAPIAISSELPTPPESQARKSAVELRPARLLSDDVFDDIDDFDSGLPPSNQNAESQNSFADIDDFQAVPPALPSQAHSGYLNPPVSAPAMDVAAGSSQQRRGRTSKVNSVLPAISAAAPPPTLKASSHRQRLPSTPLKGSGRFGDIEEILDSEDEILEAFSPTPPRVRKLQDSPPLPLIFDREPSASARGEVGEPAITPISCVQISQLIWSNIKPSICALITAHVRSIPPTKDPKKPSWHEKILMYEPIILEDFTAYLNSNTKLRTYKRATQKQIKAYNMELKIKGNAILGVERDDQVLAIEKELEVYMVRDWCQEMSICCIHAKESRGRGSARKGFY